MPFIPALSLFKHVIPCYTLSEPVRPCLSINAGKCCRNIAATNVQIAMKQFKYFTVTAVTTPEDLKKQYFSLAQKYHPDAKTELSCKEKFQELSEEYRQALEYLKKQSSAPENSEKLQAIDTLLEEFITENITRPVVRKLVDFASQWLDIDKSGVS